MYTTPAIVFGFHGCDREVAERVIRHGEPLAPSEQSYDWLGHGVYFWEGSAERALSWAEEKYRSKKIKAPAVIGAVISLGHCVDLLDERDIRQLATTYDLLKEELDALGESLPTNRRIEHGVSFVRELDCRVIMRLHQLNNEQIARDLQLDAGLSVKARQQAIQTHPQFFDSVRGMFPEGKELYPGAGFREANHIQLCIVNPNCILGYFSPIQPDKQFKRF